MYNVYLDIKSYEIQDNYVALNTFLDIVFKKYLFEQKSPAFMKYMQKMPFVYIYEFINKFLIKKSSIIKLNEIFTILGLLNKIIPKKDQIINIMKNINDKLKYNIFLSKKDFMENKLWFEKENKKQNLNNKPKELRKGSKSIRSPSIVDINFENKLKDSISKERKNKVRGSRVFPKLKFNMLNSSKENVKEISEEDQLKEYLFNINKNNEELIDMVNFKNIISIRKNVSKKKGKMLIANLSDIKSNIDKDEILSINSVVESIDKTQISESSNKFLKEAKSKEINNSSNNNSKYDKNKILKNAKINEGNNNINEYSEEKININLPEYTYFDYLIKI